MDISEEESEEILSEIDRVASAPGPPGTNGKLQYKAKKRGIALLLIVNLSAVAIIAAGTLLFSYFFRQRESAIVADTEGYETAESRLIERLRRESEQQISQKEREIEETRERLDSIRREKETLQAEMNDRISEREAELRSAMEKELESERQQLLREGKTAEEIEMELAALEREKEEEYQEAMESFRMQAQQELTERTEELEQLTEEYTGIIEQQQREQEELREVYGAELAGLREELEERDASFSRERSLIEEELAGLEEQLQNRQLISDQIQAFYQRVRGSLNNGELDNALAQLTSLEEYLSGESIASLPYMQDRVSVELFIIDSLEELIEKERESRDAGGEAELSRAAELTYISERVEEADEYYREGDFEKAAEVYIAAFSRIPALQKSYSRLQEINGLDFKRRKDNFSEWIEKGNEQFARGNYAQSLAHYEVALEFVKEDYGRIDLLADRFAEAGYTVRINRLIAQETERARQMLREADRLLEAQRFTDAISIYTAAVQRYPNSSLLGNALGGLQASLQGLIDNLEEELQAAKETIERYESSEAADLRRNRTAIIDRIDTIREQFSGYAEYTDGAGESSRDELYSLVEAKLLMRRILSSDEIRSRYPDLYENVQKYHEDYGKEQWKEGRSETMRDIIAFLDILNRPEDYAESDLEEQAEKLRLRGDLFAEFLHKLEALLR